MADFRRFIPALAVLALLVGLMPTASAQISCNTTVVPPTVRSEGMTELVGDIVLTCVGGTTSAASESVPLPTVNITVYFSTAVTSRLLNGSSSASEALLLIDDPAPAQQNAVNGTAAIAVFPNGAGTEFKTGASPNVYEGSWSSSQPSAITFLGIPVDAPGTSGNRIFRITNVRVNASAVAGSSNSPGQVTALVSVTPATGSTSSSLSLNNQNAIVAFVQSGLTFSLLASNESDALGSSGVSIRQCTSLASSKTTASFFLRYAENFATSFKPQFFSTGNPQNIPGTIYNSESGFWNPVLTIGGLSSQVGSAGRADYGTRFRAIFNNIPAGVNVWVGVRDTVYAGTKAAVLVGSETGQFFSVPATDTSNFGFTGAAVGAAQLPVVNGSAEAVYEVLASSPSANESLDFPVWFTTTASVSTNSPAPGTITANGSFAPAPPAFTASAGTTASASLSIPRFVDTSTAKTVAIVSVCRTSILFPFTTNALGFDTGLAISNTTTDPFGTAAQAGTCTLNFYGTSAPNAPVTSASVASGTSYVALVSQLAPNFQGYIIAVCNFQLGHGFAFVSDMGAQKLAMGYLGLVLPDPPRQATGVTLTGGSGEILGN